MSFGQRMAAFRAGKGKGKNKGKGKGKKVIMPSKIIAQQGAKTSMMSKKKSKRALDAEDRADIKAGHKPTRAEEKSEKGKKRAYLNRVMGKN